MKKCYNINNVILNVILKVLRGDLIKLLIVEEEGIGIDFIKQILLVQIVVQVQVYQWLNGFQIVIMENCLQKVKRVQVVNLHLIYINK